MKTKKLEHRFVEFIPEHKKEGIIYISIDYCIAIHKCACGCGREVVTPLSPTDWQLMFDGETISLSPSIGNWNFPCRSHYWIKQNRIITATENYQEKIHHKKTEKRSLLKRLISLLFNLS